MALAKKLQIRYVQVLKSCVTFFQFFSYIQDNVLIICLDLLCRNNIQIGNITCNLKGNFELLPCIVKRHFKAILHLHTCFQYLPCLHNVFCEK
jgi:hypothetical protein